jgi:hypothetical protein
MDARHLFPLLGRTCAALHFCCKGHRRDRGFVMSGERRLWHVAFRSRRSLVPPLPWPKPGEYAGVHQIETCTMYRGIAAIWLAHAWPFAREYMHATRALVHGCQVTVPGSYGPVKRGLAQAMLSAVRTTDMRRRPGGTKSCEIFGNQPRPGSSGGG